MKKMKCFMLVALVLVPALLLAGCDADADDFERLVRDGSYMHAIECYRELRGDAVEEIKAKRFLGDYLDESFDDYAAGYLSEDEFAAIYETIQSVENQFSILGEDMYGVVQEYENLLYSRSCYAQAEAFMEEEDYLAAAEYYAMVIPNDGLNYFAAQDGWDAAMQAHQEKSLQKIEEFLAEDDLDAALELTEDGQLQGNPEMEQTIVDYTVEELERICDADEVDYIAALELANLILGLYPDNSEMQEVLDILEEEYFLEAGEAARELFFESGDYAAAARTLEVCAANIREENAIQSDLDGVIEYLYSFAPQNLLDIPSWYNDSGEIFYFRKEIKDNKGNTYEGYYVAESTDYMWNAHYNGTAVFETDGVYEIFSGRVIISEDDKDLDDCGYVKIYGNGSLIWQSGSMGKGSAPKDFNLDISSYSEITVKFQEGESYKGNCYLVDSFFQKSVEDMEAPDAPKVEAPAVQPEEEDQLVIRDKNDTYCNFRTGPGTNYDVICRISNGSRAEETDVAPQGSWSCVEYNGQTGWLSTAFVFSTDVWIESSEDSYVNFRSGPGTDYAVLTTIPSGSRAAAGSELDDGEWCQIIYDGVQGWVHRKFVF